MDFFMMSNGSDESAIVDYDSPDDRPLGQFEYKDTLGRRFRRPPPGMGGKGVLLSKSSEKTSGLTKGLLKRWSFGDLKRRAALRKSIRPESRGRGFVVAKKIQPLPKVQLVVQAEHIDVHLPFRGECDSGWKCTTPQLCARRQLVDEPCFCDKYHVPYMSASSDSTGSWEELVEGFEMSSF